MDGSGGGGGSRIFLFLINFFNIVKSVFWISAISQGIIHGSWWNQSGVFKGLISMSVFNSVQIEFQIQIWQMCFCWASVEVRGLLSAFLVLITTILMRNPQVISCGQRALSYRNGSHREKIIMYVNYCCCSLILATNTSIMIHLQSSNTLCSHSLMQTNFSITHLFSRCLTCCTWQMWIYAMYCMYPIVPPIESVQEHSLWPQQMSTNQVKRPHWLVLMCAHHTWDGTYTLCSCMDNTKVDLAASWSMVTQGAGQIQCCEIFGCC